MPKASSKRPKSVSAISKIKGAKSENLKAKAIKGKSAKADDVKTKTVKDKHAKTSRAKAKPGKKAAATPAREQAWSADTIPSLPHMEDAGIALLGEHLTGVQVFLEYGSGGSSVMVAQAGVKSIYSVDSDKQFLKAVKQRLLDEGIPRRRYIPIYADIGPTKEWGKPADESHLKEWPNYCSAPWKKLLKTGERPDLVLIDGRFRVASFLITVLMAPRGCVILFDDYVDRPQYHVIERYLKPVRLAGRMAEFVVQPFAEPFAALVDLLRYSTESG